MFHAPISRQSAIGLDEDYRLAVLHALDLLDSPAEAEFDALTALARRMSDCPIAVISLVDENRQWFKSRCGIAATETTREVAFCDHAIRSSQMMVVPDARADARFADNPLVTGDPHIRFYAGMPIHARLHPQAPAVVIGTICIIDTRPRILSPKQVDDLRDLAQIAESLIQGRRHLADALTFAGERDTAAQQVARQHRQMMQAERMAEVGSWRLDLADNSVIWSDQLFAIHGLAVGQQPSLDEALAFYAPHHRALVSAQIAATIETGEPFDFESDFISADGRAKRVRSMGELEIVDGQPVALIGAFQDVTDRFALEQALRRSAQLDPMTGIANRAGFTQQLDEAMDGARRDNERLALLLIDLDGFKPVNDNFGHRTGDELLQGIAHRLQMPYLSGCIPARLGGDEFALIVPGNPDPAAVDLLASRLLDAMRRPVDVALGQLCVGASIGIAWWDGITARSDLVHRADLALYDAKRRGKGVACTYQADIARSA